MKLKVEASRRYQSFSGYPSALKYAFQVLEISEDVFPLRIYKPPLLRIYRSPLGALFIKEKPNAIKYELIEEGPLTPTSSSKAIELLKETGVNLEEYLFCADPNVRKFMADLLSD